MSFSRNTGCRPPAVPGGLCRATITGGVLLVLCLFTGVASVSARAQEMRNETAEPFEYAWEVRFRGEAIGYSLTRFSFLTDEDEGEFCALGYRSFTFEIGPVILRFTEQSRTVWDDRGDMLEFEARTVVGGDVVTTRVLRTTDGVSVVKETEKEAEEFFFWADEYDHTDADRFLHTLSNLDGKTTFRILSISEERVKDVTYEFLGACDFEISGESRVCSRVGFEGPRSTGEMLVDERGIPLSFSMNTVLGSFTFVPCDPTVAKEVLFLMDADVFDDL